MRRPPRRREESGRSHSTFACGSGFRYVKGTTRVCTCGMVEGTQGQSVRAPNDRLSILTTPGADKISLTRRPGLTLTEIRHIRRIWYDFAAFGRTTACENENIPPLPRLCPDMTGRRREGTADVNPRFAITALPNTDAAR